MKIWRTALVTLFNSYFRFINGFSARPRISERVRLGKQNRWRSWKSFWTPEHKDGCNGGCDCRDEHAETKEKKRRSNRNIPVRFAGVEVIEYDQQRPWNNYHEYPGPCRDRRIFSTSLFIRSSSLRRRMWKQIISSQEILSIKWYPYPLRIFLSVLQLVFRPQTFNSVN